MIFFSGGTTDEVFIYNITSKAWRTGEPLKLRRWAATMHVVNGQLTVFGGYNGYNNGNGTVEVFNGTSWNVNATLKNSYYQGHASFVFPIFS